MSDTKITSVEPTNVPDELRVTGKVGKQVVQVSVWRSHLYGDPIDPNAVDDDGRYHRAPDKLGGAKPEKGAPADPVHAEQNAGPRDPEVPRTDARRRKYLVSQLEAAASRVEADKALEKLVD